MPGADPQRDALERHEGAEALAQIDDLEDGRRRTDGRHPKASSRADGGGDGAEHAVLHLDHLERRLVVAEVGGAAAVGQQEALVAPVVGLAHGGVHADVGGDARRG